MKKIPFVLDIFTQRSQANNMKGEMSVFLFSSVILFLSACNEDETTSSCGNNASAFTGSWNITEQCGIDEFSYLLTITENSTGGITLTNLGDGGPNAVVNATINGNSGFTIPAQVVQVVTITGNGSLNGGCVELLIQWAGWKGNCTATGSK